tara:strand:- start:399 stop:620 length:222 start_codon:yes stop_codon:yes gene_type:complete
VLREKIKEVSSRRESFLLALQWCRAHACAWRSGKQQGSEEREGINGRLRDKGPKGSSTPGFFHALSFGWPDEA